MITPDPFEAARSVAHARRRARNALTEDVRDVLRDAALLMERYADTPMDFADATLVLLAGDLGVADLATLDRRGFLTYRFSGKKAFRLVLD